MEALDYVGFFKKAQWNRNALEKSHRGENAN